MPSAGRHANYRCTTQNAANGQFPLFKGTNGAAVQISGSSRWYFAQHLEGGIDRSVGYHSHSHRFDVWRDGEF